MNLKIKTDALVLGSFPFGESHKAVTLFTPEYGIMKGVAHGSRKPTSKFGSSMEMLNTVEVVITLSKRNELHTIKEHTLKNSRHSLRGDADSMGYIFYLVEFLKEIFHEAPPNKSVYNLIINFIDNVPEGDSYLIHRALTIKILKILGFIGEFDVCAECGAESSTFYISRYEGFIFCQECKKNTSDMQINAGTVQILKKLYHDSLKDITRLKISEKQKYEIDETVNTIIKGILGKPLKSESYFYLNSSV